MQVGEQERPAEARKTSRQLERQEDFPRDKQEARDKRNS
jgi:hypothetical protein